ncbi:hypothetical protein COLO4_30353 [Corchorus olitorius]|uniref:Thionin-like protein 2 n=1 Tax=Corchorus olitorius TaxID=93759 RepID=A0A1R3H8Y5_9ROSI|nr:hypothetical protein COLO4_30353 [Corchorus olitorius]
MGVAKSILLMPQNSAFSCGVNCLKSCIVPTSTLTSLRDKDTQYFCKLGCATSLCTHFSTKDNPGGKEVGRCVDSCSGTCAKKN